MQRFARHRGVPPARPVIGVAVLDAQTAGRRAMPHLWTGSVVAMVAIFYAANVYDTGLAGQLYYAKWPLVLPVIGLSWWATRLAGPAPGPAPSPMPLVLLAFAALLSALAAASMGDSLTFFVSLLVAFATSYSLAYAILKAQGEQQFFDAIALVGRIVIASAAIMWALGLNLGRGVDRFSAWTDNPNTLALLLAPTLVILTADVLERRRGWLWWSAPFLAAGLLLLMVTGSRASVLWICAAALGFTSFQRGIGVSLAVGIVLLVLAVEFWGEITGAVLDLLKRETVSDVADVLSGRSEIWPLGLQLFAESPIVGHGIGTSQALLAQHEWAFVEHQGRHFHSSYLTVAVETGLVGLIAVLLVLLMALVGGMRLSSWSRRQGHRPTLALPWAMMIGGLAHALFETWLLSAGNANMILVWTCILLLLARVNFHGPVSGSLRRVVNSPAPGHKGP